ncbi:LacI family DNA-binding transcriptional regulator [Geminisphaera colitermitum]|uniref:LacI family DNA-binding transcriptional regulator n=1 Tax=Geminisphaera colitermitum TaxID=1148786 RepID=UPI0003035952|nr:GntR family transcriptional regulator [Geminisphaera colitermitum]
MTAIISPTPATSADTHAVSSPKSKLEAVYELLKRQIAEGKWQVGEQIPTEVELARELDCSRSTMGMAISRLAHDGLVERKTRAGTRVLRAIPAHARDTADSTTATPAAPVTPPVQLDACAFIYPSDQHEGIWRIARGFQQAAHQARRQTLMLSTGTDFRREAEAVGRLGEFDVKGAVLFPVILTPQDHAYYSRMVLACKFPVVLVEINMLGVRRPAVTVDGLHAGLTMTRHLLQQRLRRVGFLANYAWSPSARDKHLGYRQAMEEAGLSSDSATLTHLDPEMTPRFDDPLADPLRIGHEYLDTHPDIEGVVCSSDYLALGLMQAAHERGLRVPDDIRITGMDDFSIAASAGVPLTTYRISYEKMGERAFAMLSLLLENKKPPLLETQIRGELITRASA